MLWIFSHPHPETQPLYRSRKTSVSLIASSLVPILPNWSINSWMRSRFSTLRGRIGESLEEDEDFSSSAGKVESNIMASFWSLLVATLRLLLQHSSASCNTCVDWLFESHAENTRQKNSHLILHVREGDTKLLDRSKGNDQSLAWVWNFAVPAPTFSRGRSG